MAKRFGWWILAVISWDKADFLLIEVDVLMVGCFGANWRKSPMRCGGSVDSHWQMNLGQSDRTRRTKQNKNKNQTIPQLIRWSKLRKLESTPYLWQWRYSKTLKMLRASPPKHSRFLNRNSAIGISRKATSRIPVITGRKHLLGKIFRDTTFQKWTAGWSYDRLSTWHHRKISFHNVVCIHRIQLLKVVTIAPFQPGFPFSQPIFSRQASPIFRCPPQLVLGKSSGSRPWALPGALPSLLVVSVSKKKESPLTTLSNILSQVSTPS